MNENIFLTACFNEKKLLSITVDEEEYSGFLVDFNQLFLCLSVLNTWHLDGYIVVPFNKVSDVSEENQLLDIIAFTKISSRVSSHEFLDLSDFSSMFESIKTHENIVSIENKEDFALGEVSVVERESVTINGYTPSGKMELNSHLVPYDEISVITIGDEYASVLNSFVNDNR